MTDTQYLDDVIKNSGLRMNWLAEQLGITPKTFIDKRMNRSEFTASEIKKLCDILNIKEKERSRIFFN